MWQRERVTDVFVQMEISPLSVCLTECPCGGVFTPAHWMILEQHVLFSTIVHSHKDCKMHTCWKTPGLCVIQN